MSNEIPKYSNSNSNSSQTPSNDNENSNSNYEGIKFKLDISSLSLDCSIPLGSNLNFQLGIPQSTSTNQQNSKSSHFHTGTTSSNPITVESQSNKTFQNDSIPSNINSELFLLNLVNSFINRLENVERELEKEKNINKEFRIQIDDLKDKLNNLNIIDNSIESIMKKDLILKQDQSYKSPKPSKEDYMKNEFLISPSEYNSSQMNKNQKEEFQLQKDHIEPDKIDENECWQDDSEYIKSEQEVKSDSNFIKAENKNEDFEEDDPSELGLNDDQTILYGFKPKQK
ncbi:uncharacterized protein I206_107108 [Kwoniella pini CBS 10737]|uniref:Uncharacterized protein n=1 Tax=Kwoniella pini CBS 10737 TaxID=1296096 RepID=A0A1B9HZ56_9TREE|nr:uncharacterized protein I206_05348 [Kwoniella pini CBS 10737]OCF48569.1 hypothetical protein I206_05348 [Kwoniella pini CBS 10737]